MLRSARIEDVRQIHRLLSFFADKGLLLGRSLHSLYDQVRDFKVMVEGETESMAGDGRMVERVIGVGALHICWEDLAEIRSLAVDEEFQGRGVGATLVRSFLDEARGFGIRRVFTLTYQPGFFQKLGFCTIDKGQLPHKVWSDCINCPKFPDCNEEALVWDQWDETGPSPARSA